MQKRSTRPLAILTGVVFLVGACWITLERLTDEYQLARVEGKVQFGETRDSEKSSAKKSSKQRSVNELKLILAEATKNWMDLADTRYFFEDYADEIVSDFSLREIELLAFDFTGADYRDFHGFEHAAMRRWGHLDFKNGHQHLIASIGAAEQKEDNRQRHSLEILEYYYEQLRNGHSLDSPSDAISRIVDAAKSRRGIRSRHQRENAFIEQLIAYPKPNNTEEIIKNLTRNDLEAMETLLGDKETLDILSPDSDPFSTEENPAMKPILRGYFRGLSPESNWIEIFDSLDDSFKNQAMAPMMGRWLAKDQSAAIAWLADQPEGRFLELYLDGEIDPFSSTHTTTNNGSNSARHFRTLGRATAFWFRDSPNYALAFLEKHLEIAPPEFFSEVLASTVDHNNSRSVAGFFHVKEKLELHKNPLIRHQILIEAESIQDRLFDLSSFLPRPERGFLEQKRRN